MSALPPRADMRGAKAYVRYGPIADIEGKPLRQVARPPCATTSRQWIILLFTRGHHLYSRGWRTKSPALCVHDAGQCFMCIATFCDR